MMSDNISAGDVITMGPNAGTIYDGKFGTVDQTTLWVYRGFRTHMGSLILILHIARIILA